MSKIALLVDDEASNIDLLRSLLPDDIKVKAATSGALALRIATKSMPDIIFMDVLMPELSGPETCTKLRELPGGEQVNIIYISGSELAEDIKNENGFIQKPLNQQKLMNILSEFL